MLKTNLALLRGSKESLSFSHMAEICHPHRQHFQTRSRRQDIPTNRPLNWIGTSDDPTVFQNILRHPNLGQRVRATLKFIVWSPNVKIERFL